MIFWDEAPPEPSLTEPPDFPYYGHVTQRRYEGPSVIYLGAGWALTAKHVGQGEITLDGRFVAPHPRSRHTLMNVDGSPADAMVFELDRDAWRPDLPILPIARSPAELGEEVLLIGFGRTRAQRFEWGDPESPRSSFRWSAKGEKRWGTNRIANTGEWIAQGSWTTRSIATRFDEPGKEGSTAHEAQGALGDSGGAIFVHREGEWQLLGLITSITNPAGAAPRTTTAGDMTFAADLSFYRGEILRWTRPACSNEEDDDGDGAIDHPDDRGCRGPTDDDERERAWIFAYLPWTKWLGVAGLAALLGMWVTARD